MNCFYCNRNISKGKCINIKSLNNTYLKKECTTMCHKILQEDQIPNVRCPKCGLEFHTNFPLELRPPCDTCPDCRSIVWCKHLIL